MSATHTCMSRRVLVGGGLAGVGAWCLAACSDADPDPAQTTGAEQTETPTADPPTDDGEGDGEQDGGGQEQDGEAIAAVDDIPVGGALAVQIDGAPAVLTRPSSDEVLAFSAICTHEGCQVSPGDGELACPCHGSVFALADGSVESGPADAPLPSIGVEVIDGQVFAA